MNITEKRKSYDLKFKQSVTKYAEENRNREAGRKFSVDESMVRRWRQKSSEISDKSSSQSKKRRLSFGGPEGQPTEEARILLDESSESLEFIARPTLDDVYEIEVEDIENVDDLTDKIIEECEMEILS